MRGIGREAIGTGTPCDCVGREKRAFEEDLGGLQRDATLFTAHDAGQRQRAVFVGDQQRVGSRGHRLFVEQQHLLALHRKAHMDCALEAGVVESVQRLPEFEHDVVGDIHQRADRPDATALQTLLHPVRRRRLGIDALEHTTAIARTGLGRIEHDRAPIVDRRHHGSKHGTHQRDAGKRRDLARHPGQTQAVRTVWRELDGEQGIVERQVLADVHTHRCIVGQRVQPAMLVGQSKLTLGAQHAEGFDTTQLGCLDGEIARQHRAHLGTRHLHADSRIGCAADDLEELSGARVDLAQLELVRIRMLFGFDDLRHDNAGKSRRHGFGFFHFKARHGHKVTQRGTIKKRIGEGPQPVFGKLHDSLT